MRTDNHRALSNPNVSVTRDGETLKYLAVLVSEQERECLLDESGFPKVAYVFTGFAPRKVLRLYSHQVAGRIPLHHPHDTAA